MRILMTTDAVGGVWTYAIELIRALPEHQFALAVLGPRMSEVQRREISALPNLAIFEHRYALEWMDAPWEQVDRSGEWLLQIAADFRPDLVHLNGYSHAVLPFGVPIVVVAHSCVLSWWQAVKKSPVPNQYNEYRRRVTAGLRAADAVIAPTDAMLTSLRINYDFRGDGHVIANARDSRMFAPRAKLARVLAVGRVWDEAKNIAMLDAIAAGVRWPIEVAGETTHPNGRAMQLRNVQTLGVLTPGELREHLAASSIYVLPARYEPFGLSAVEAALSECALVLGDIPSLREVWGDAAVFVDPEDRVGLQITLNNLTRDEPRRHELAQAARARAAKFSPARMAAEYRRIYTTANPQPAGEVAA